MEKVISVARYEGALHSAVHGTCELVAMANLVRGVMGEGDALVARVIDIPSAKKVGADDIGDALVLPPLLRSPGEEELAVDPRIIDWLQTVPPADTVICGCCTAVELMAEAGLLKGRKATTTWWYLRNLSARFPNIDFQDNEMVVADGAMITSSGPYSYIAQVLNLVERFSGPGLARMLAKIAVVEPGRPVAGIFAVPTLFSTFDPLLARAQEIIARDVAKGVSVRSLAGEVGLSERTFHRRIVERAGMTPQQFIASIRIEIAKSMLETTLDPIAVVASAVGFKDVSSFRSAFSKAVGTTPTAYRARMNPWER